MPCHHNSNKPVKPLSRDEYIKRCIGKEKQTDVAKKECSKMFDNSQKKPKKLK